jgi:hypothetical protein
MLEFRKKSSRSAKNQSSTENTVEDSPSQTQPPPVPVQQTSTVQDAPSPAVEHAPSASVREQPSTVAPEPTTPSQDTRPFSYVSRPDVDRRIDDFVIGKGPDFQARIDATPKIYFVRCWLLAQVERNENKQRYYEAVDSVLSQPEHRHLKENLNRKFGRVPENQRRARILREAGERFKTEGINVFDQAQQGQTQSLF